MGVCLVDENSPPGAVWLFYFRVSMIVRADIEGSKSNVAMNAWLPQASCPCGNFSDTSSWIFLRPSRKPRNARVVFLAIFSENKERENTERLFSCWFDRWGRGNDKPAVVVFFPGIPRFIPNALGHSLLSTSKCFLREPPKWWYWPFGFCIDKPQWL